MLKKMTAKPETKQKRSRSRSRRDREKRKRSRTVFADPYELPMYPEVREKYAKASDAALASWKDNHLQELIAESKTEPQKAIDKAAEQITKALLGAAKNVLQTREIRARRPAMPQRRYPAYWNADLQMQHRTIKHARQQVRIATEYGDPDEIQQTEQALQLAVAHL